MYRSCFRRIFVLEITITKYPNPTKDQENQDPAYALKSDDGETRTDQYPKRRPVLNPNPAYAPNQSDDGERPLKPG